MGEAREIPLQIANLARNLLYLGQVYSDPRDALNEFVSNAADEYAQAGRAGGVIRIVLQRTGREPQIVISDAGRGMMRQRLEHIAVSLCESEKAQTREAAAVIGEKGIGILAFASLAKQCDLVTRPEGGNATFRMRLRLGAETCEIGDERQRPRTAPGTDVYLTGIGKDIWRVLTVPKLSEYFRLRRRQALLAGDYAIELVEGRKTTPVKPEVYKGIPYEVPPIRSPHGQIRIHLFLWPKSAPGRSVSIVGKGGTTIVDDLATLDEFRRAPWNMGQLQGEVIFPPLEQTTGRKGIVRDATRFPALVHALTSLEDSLTTRLQDITKEQRERLNRDMFFRLREIFAQVMRDLRDIENPMQVIVSDPKGEPGRGGVSEDRVPGGHRPETKGAQGHPSIVAIDPERPETSRQGPRPLPTWRLTPFAEAKRHLRSEFDSDTRVINVNEVHPDYQGAHDNPTTQLNYLMMLTAKELALWQNPPGDALMASEDMVKILVRARRYASEKP